LKLHRRDFLKGITAAPVLAAAPALCASQDVLVNDVHAGLNPTWVRNVVRPGSVAEIQVLTKDCRKHGRSLSVSGSRHATGGQQFAAHSVLLDMREMNHVVDLDNKKGLLQVESGIEWPALIQRYLAAQKNNAAWGIRQKQGGADHMTLAGALSANAHGHCLGSPPMIGDVEWIDIVTADGKLQRCSRKENSELFALAVGGYGLFGVITNVGLRLVPRGKVRRRVEARTLAELVELVEKRTASGASFGYFQYSIDPTSPEFMRAGVLTTYEPVAPETALGKGSTDLDEDALALLLELAHRNPQRAYTQYAKYELSLDRNVEWSDLHQLSTYPLGYHKNIEKRLGAEFEGADLILEVYVPRDELIPYFEDARRLLLTSEIPLIYGTVRFIEQDRDSFLAWAKKRYACVIFTVHSSSEAHALGKMGEICRQLIRSGVKRSGSFYLTYNRFAAREELDSAYPQFGEFLVLKKKYDPMELFQSDWYRHYKALYQ
jgi:FAD/FMN-containing dehydrogenase